jgi:hypothetical protein
VKRTKNFEMGVSVQSFNDRSHIHILCRFCTSEGTCHSVVTCHTYTIRIICTSEHPFMNRWVVFGFLALSHFLEFLQLETVNDAKRLIWPWRPHLMGKKTMVMFSLYVALLDVKRFRLIVRSKYCIWLFCSYLDSLLITHESVSTCLIVVGRRSPWRNFVNCC